MYSLPCSHCGQPISVSASKAGQEVPCPHCESSVQVPKLGELKSLAPAAEVDSNAPAAQAAGSHSAAGSIVFVALAMLATACLLVAGFCGIRWYLIEVPLTTQQHISETKVALQDASAAQLIIEYESLEEYGIDVKKPFPYQMIANTKAKWGLNALVASAVGTAAVLGAATAASRR